MITGDLDRLHLGDLVQWLQMGSLTGRLTLTADGCERRLDFLDGRVVFVSSAAAEERLATWLAREGVVPAAELRRALAASLVQRLLFTDMLMERRTVAAADLRRSIARLAQVITTRVLLATTVRFDFDPAFPVRDLLNLNLDLEPHSLLMEAARQSDESTSSEHFPDEQVIPSSGEAFERFFWQLVRAGVSSEELLDGEQVVELHTTVRSLMATLTQWLASSPGLVPVPENQIEGLSSTPDELDPARLVGSPHVVWNLMVLACAVRSPDLNYPDAISALELPDPEVWSALVASNRWRRPAAGQLDRLVPTAVSSWTRAAAAAADALGEDPEMAALAVHLLAVPTDLVLWVLTTVPVGHQHLRQVLLRELPPRLGSALARRADLPTVFRELMEPDARSRLGLCLDIGRQTLTSAQLWPATAPTDGRQLGDIAGKRARTKATTAAWKAVAGTRG